MQKKDIGMRVATAGCFSMIAGSVAINQFGVFAGIVSILGIGLALYGLVYIFF